MSVTYGFYNSKDGDRKYDAIQMSSIFDGIVVDGVLIHVGGQMIVSADGDSMTVKVAPGRAWFNHTWTLNDSILPLEVPQAEMILDRIDAVVIDVDSSIEVRANTIKIVRGIGATDPQRPTLINTADHHQYPLAYIKVTQMATTIRQADITNMVGTSACPFCTAPLEKMDIDALVAQWGDQWNQFYETETTEIVNMKESWNTELSNYYEEKKAEMNQWEIDAFNQFNTWFETLQDLIDEDVAVTLATQILEIQGQIETLNTEIADLETQSAALVEALKTEIQNGTVTAAQAAHANTADSATLASRANNADYATSAGSATSAGYADSSGYANSAGGAPWNGISGKPSTFTPSAHTHPAGQITAGTLAAAVLASYGTDYGTSRLRNSRFSTTDLSPGVSALNNGEIFGVYE